MVGQGPHPTGSLGGVVSDQQNGMAIARLLTG
jgi:hypothetical protein